MFNRKSYYYYKKYYGVQDRDKMNFNFGYLEKFTNCEGLSQFLNWL